jgi:DinB family protein
MEQNLEYTIALLSRTPAALDALLRNLPEAWTLQNEGEKTMSAWDVVGHLAYADRTNWIPRAKMILEFGEARAFEPFKRWGHLKESQGKSLGDLLDEFAGARAESLRELRAMNLQPVDFARRGGHPAFGVATLSQLLAAWAVHDMTHLHQISRILSHQYREAVGPWSAYLGVLKCNGHSSPQ